jgi:hypothetical protein
MQDNEGSLVDFVPRRSFISPSVPLLRGGVGRGPTIQLLVDHSVRYQPTTDKCTITDSGCRSSHIPWKVTFQCSCPVDYEYSH